MNKLAIVVALALFALPFVAQANEHAAPVDAASAPVAAESAAPVAAESAHEAK